MNRSYDRRLENCAHNNLTCFLESFPPRLTVYFSSLASLYPPVHELVVVYSSFFSRAEIGKDYVDVIMLNNY